MAKSNGKDSRLPPSRLGRGLGALIPVSINNPARSGAGANLAQASEAHGTASKPVVQAVQGADSGPAHTGRTAGAGPRDHGATALADSSSEAEPKPSRAISGEPGIEFLPLSSLRNGRYQPRSSMDQPALNALAGSIATAGLMQPLVVRPLASEPGAYEVIAGERRWRALEILGRAEAPAMVRHVGDQQAAELALVENLQREDLNAMDRAAALQRLTEEFGLTHQQVAERVGVERVSVTNLLRLNELDLRTAEFVRTGSLSAGHGKVLAGITDVSVRVRLAESAAREEWSVRQLERNSQDDQIVPRGTKRGSGAKQLPSAHIARLERALEGHLGTRVRVKLGRKKGVGEVRIQFFSLDEFDGLMQRIGFQDGETHLTV